MSPARARLPAWWRRLSVRIAAVSALGMLSFYLLGRQLEEIVARALDLPNAVLSVDWVAEDLLRDATREAEGRWRPTEASIQRVSNGDGEDSDGTGFAWLSTQFDVLACSPGAPFGVDDRWPGTSEMSQHIDWTDGSHVHAICLPVEKDEVLAGYWVSLLVDRHRHAEMHGVAEDELDSVDSCWFSHPEKSLTWAEMESQQQRICAATSLLVAVVTALLVAWMASRMVTRRLSRLAAAVGEQPEGDALPGPFPTRGTDEVASLATALNQLRTRARELLDRLAHRDLSRREWVAQVAHDLRTPLTALMVCLDRAETAPNEQQLRELLSIARLDAARVRSIAEDLLELERLDGDPELAIEPVLPGELVRRAVLGLGPIAERAGVAIELQLARGLPVVQGDGNRLMRALENLLENAIRHAQARIVVQVVEHEAGVRFEVRDDGSGFGGGAVVGTVDLLSPALPRDRHGSGLGLRVASRIASAHGGNLEAENPASGGAVVALWLPHDQVA